MSLGSQSVVRQTVPSRQLTSTSEVSVIFIKLPLLNELSPTRSAISRQIQQLEENLLAPWFERRQRAIALTEAGQILLCAVNDRNPQSTWPYASAQSWPRAQPGKTVSGSGKSRYVTSRNDPVATALLGSIKFFVGVADQGTQGNLFMCLRNTDAYRDRNGLLTVSVGCFRDLGPNTFGQGGCGI
jgi:hypothetical protein